MTNIYASGGEPQRKALVQPAPLPPAETPSDGAADLKVGDIDANGTTIQCIYAKTQRYVIYSAESQVRFSLPGNYDVARVLRARIAGLGGLRTSIEDLRAEQSIGNLDRVRAGRELAWALGEAFEDTGDTPSDQPKEILTRVDSRLRTVLKSQCRKRYVFANLAAFAVIEISLASIAAGVHALNLLFLQYTEYGMMGALGAFLSVIAGIKSIDFNIDLKPWEHVFTGATRILIGVIGGWVVGLALDAALIDPTFGHRNDGAKGAEHAHVAMYLILCFIGGFSETLVPNLLRRGEESMGTPNTKPSSDEPIVGAMKP